MERSRLRPLCIKIPAAGSNNAAEEEVRGCRTGFCTSSRKAGNNNDGYP